MKLLIDMDDTACDLLTPWCEYINKTFNTNYRPSTVDRWDLENLPGCDLRVRDFLFTRDLYRTLTPKKNAIEVMQMLYNDGHELKIVTSPPDMDDHIMECKLAWMDQHCDWFTGEIVFTEDKSKVKGDVLFDDGPHNLEAWKHGKGIAMAYNFNRGWPTRVKNWNEFYREVKKYETVLSKNIL